MKNLVIQAQDLPGSLFKDSQISTLQWRGNEGVHKISGDKPFQGEVESGVTR